MQVFEVPVGPYTEIYGYGNPLAGSFYPWHWWMPCGFGLWHLVPCL